ncbi:MAG: hypothetical protein LUB62_03875 [Prevotellaceae bacterium]|nr:hypothetical protein [Prevotellaceae bacterium]
MGLFGKRSKPAAGAGETRQADTLASEEQLELSATAESVARQWWEEKTGSPMPDEVDEWIRQLTRTEARRLNIATAMLTPEQEEQVRSDRKLGEVRMENIESQMRRARIQKSLLDDYERLKQTLKEHSAKLYSLTKELEDKGKDAEALDRFEALEPIHGQWLRLGWLLEASEDNRKLFDETLAELEGASGKEAEELEAMRHLGKELEESEKQMRAVGEKIEQVYHIQGERTILNLDIHSIQEFIASLQQRKQALGQELGEQTAEEQRLRAEMARVSAAKASLEPHKQMLSQGKHLLLRLDAMSGVKAELDLVEAELRQSTEELRKANAALESVGAEAVETDADIEIINTKLQSHRTDIAEADSYTLQERALRQTTLQQMLLCAQSHWAHIRDGYQEIDETSGKLLTLRQRTESLRQSLASLNKEVEALRTECSDREHTLIVSDSQTVMQLRSNLKEGTSCAVCGALHHPYHSDTLLEQKKLLGDLRSEYEQRKAELEAKEKASRQMLTELTQKTAMLSLLEGQLTRLKERQERLVGEWEVYARLDSSLRECSSTTNMEARTEMIRQLAANADRDAKQAQQELGNHNYHQSRINELLGELAQKEQRKSELQKRLSEVNTSCQVLEKHVAYLRQSHALTLGRFRSLYEETGRLVSLPGWMGEMQADGGEALKQRIADMLERQQECEREEAQLARRLETLLSLLDKARDTEALLDNSIHHAQTSLESRLTLLQEGERSLQLLLGEADEKAFYEEALSALTRSFEAERGQAKALLEAATRHSSLKGKLQALEQRAAALSESLTRQRLGIDTWLSRHNTTGLPLQHSDLEEAFTSRLDWNALRQGIREARLRRELEQELVNLLNARVLATQADLSRTSRDIDAVTLESVRKQTDSLYTQYREVALQTAESVFRLRRHQLCLQQLERETANLESLKG